MRPLCQYEDHCPESTSRSALTGPRSKYAISRTLDGSVKSVTLMPPWYQACTKRSRPGTGMRFPLCATQFSCGVCAAGSLKNPFGVSVRPLRAKYALAPQSRLSVARHRAPTPPPHSSVKSSVLASLLNVAECQ
jgi:hypothetical protein